MGGCFARTVAGIEFGDGSIEVVGVKHNTCRDPLVGVELKDV
ncbi:Uncharacterised protein [Mycobacterium tuberculosis]|nr:Uncharacterised protein [Mycobacterium tuberculosis]